MMSHTWIAFVCGLVVGAPIGLLALALCVVAKRGDQDIDRLFSDVVPPRNTIPPRLPRT